MKQVFSILRTGVLFLMLIACGSWAGGGFETVLGTAPCQLGNDR